MFAVVVLLLTSQTEAPVPTTPTPTATTTTPEIDPWVVCFVRAVDDTRTGLGPRIEELLKTALLSNSAVTVAPTEELVEAAGRKKLAKRKWLEAGVLAPVADELDIDFLLSASVKAETRYAFKVTLRAVERSATTTVATSEVSIAAAPGKGRGGASFSSAEAQELVERLIAGLPPPPTVAVVADAGAATGATPSASSDGFDTAWSGDPADQTASNVDALLNTLAPTFSGRLGVESFFHPSDLWAPRDPDDVDGRQQVDLGLRAAVGGNKASGHIALLVRRDFADPTRARLEAEEAYADVDLYGLKLRAGRAYVAWGTTDLYAPTEVLSFFDLRDFLEIEKFPTWHLKASYTLAPLTLDAYLLPVPEVHILPPVERIGADGVIAGKNRWVKGRFGGFAPAAVPVVVSVDDGGAPGPSLDALQPALRLRLSAFGIDASVGGAWLWDRFPTLRAPDIDDLKQANPQPVLDVVVRTEVLRRLAFTSDVEFAVGAVRFAGEGVVFLTEDVFSGKPDPEVEDPFATVVVGVDTETPRWLDDQSMRFFVNLTGTFTLTGEPLPRDPIGRLRYPVPLGLLARVEYLIGESWKLEVTAINNVAGALGDGGIDAARAIDGMVQPALQVVFFDVVTTRVEAAWLYGNLAGTFGQFQENSRVGGSVGVSF